MAYITVLDSDQPKKKRYKITWTVKTLNNQRKRCSKTLPIGSLERDAKAFKREVEEKYENQIPLDFSKRSLSLFVEEYFELFSNTLSPSTLYGYKQMAYCNKGVVKHLGNYEISKITTSTLQLYINYLMNEELSPKTIKNYKAFLVSLFNKMMKLHYIPKGINPASEVEIPKQTQQKVQSYSEEEIQKIFKLLKQEPFENRLMLEICFLTGARRSEVMAMDLNSINLNKKIWHIDKCVVRGDNGLDYTKAPKSQAGVRDIALSDILCEDLKLAIKLYKQKKLAYGPGFIDSGLIFCHKDGSSYRTNIITSRWRKFLKKNKDEVRDLPLHAAGRHSFASNAIKNGLDIVALAEVLGHSDCKTTMNTYSNSFENVKLEYANQFAEKIIAKQA